MLLKKILVFSFSGILLLAFLIVASYHFGKEDTEFISYRSNQDLIYFFKGSLVITAPLLFHKAETLEIFNNLNFDIYQPRDYLKEMLPHRTSS